eukprot:TRINITY_DN3020_c3_g2_i4.p1 TRINITY_DN3020_c3_g2~~TRINITY_DN3020_c3_g2_i4.p1  ORF type:complete len:625 (-),score=107.01 TRINITY_DN3020_c3_g2_i4:304-2121(-)
MSKYVPPQLRGKEGGGAPKDDSSKVEERSNGGGGGAWRPGGKGGDRGGYGGERREGKGGGKGKRDSGDGYGDRDRGNGNAGGLGDVMSGSGGDWFKREEGRRTGKEEQTELEVYGEVKKRSTAGIDFDSYDNIPVQVTGEGTEDFQPISRFSEANLTDSLFDNLRRCGYDRPTPVQKWSIPIVTRGRDVMACAQTGSGKTCAFMVPAIESLLRAGPPSYPDRMSARLQKTPAPCVLVMAPTRELTSQIYEESRKFAFKTGIKCCVVYGGADMRDQRKELNNGVDVLVATPGRLSDMYERGIVTLGLIQFLILDEADRMLDMGFEPQVRQIVEKMDMGHYTDRPRQSMMFSATFAREVQMMARDFLNDYIFLTVGRVGSASELVEQHVIWAENREKVTRLLDSFDDHLPRDGLALVFTETKKGADGLADDLYRDGVPVCVIHGDRSQHEREHALASFKSGRNPIMVATDVASRGLDIPNVHLVVNYDMPNSIDDYVHRIGRTGRAGRRGKAIALINDRVPGNLLRDLLELLEDANQEVPDWFGELCHKMRWGGGGGGRGGYKRGGGGGGKGKGGGHRFGGRDYRQESGGGGYGGGSNSRADTTSWR